VLFDTLIAASTPDEIEAVVAHELGHDRHGHVLFGLLRTAFATLLALAAFGWLCKQDWLLPEFGLPERDDALALLVCLLLYSTAHEPVAEFGLGTAFVPKLQQIVFDTADLAGSTRPVAPTRIEPWTGTFANPSAARRPCCQPT